MASEGVVDYLDLVGDTPMVKLPERVLPEEARGVRVLLKMEMQNPGGSVKDRIAKNMIETLEKKGLINENSTLVEYTSGNTGIGLAMCCAAKGYKCVIIMPQMPSYLERYIICRQFGAQVHLTAPALGLPGLQAHLEKLLKENPSYVFTNQFQSDANPAAHFGTTGPEIWSQTGGDIDYFVAGVGTGGTINVAGRFLKEKKPEMKVVVVEPTESRVLQGESHTAHSILGIGAGVQVPFIEMLEPGAEFKEGPRGIVDEFCHATSADATQCAATLAAKAGMMIGPSAGAAVKVAIDIAKRPEAKGKTIVVICASHGIRYTAHPLWEAAKAEAIQALPSPPNMSKDETLLWTSPETLVTSST